MTIQDFIVQVTNEAIFITIIVSLPPILLSLFIGVGVAVFSATTQIQEQSLSFVPKMIAVFAVIAATGPWIGATMLRFAEHCLGGFVEVMR
jgi:flagellar biosynthetic protein FliQ